MKYILLTLAFIVSNWITFNLASGPEETIKSSGDPIIESRDLRGAPVLTEQELPEIEVSSTEAFSEDSDLSLSELGDLLLSLDESAIKNRLLEVFTTSWFAEDHRGVAEWINNQASDVDVDVAVATFSGLASEIDPEGAAEWAVSIGSTGLRENALRRTMNSFRSNDPAGFQKFLRSDSYAAREIRTTDYYAGVIEAVETEAKRFDIYEEPPEPIERILARRTRLAGSSSRTNRVELND